MKLFIPGPVDVEPDVLEQMTKPMIGHRGKNFGNLLVETTDKLKKVLYTENAVFLSTSSATGLLEGSIRNCVDKKCLNVSNGAFGESWHEIALANGKQADILEVEWGRGVTPDVIDKKLSEKNYEAITVVHNETSTGMANPIYDIAKVVKEHDVLFLVDAVSSIAGIKLEVDKLGIDVCVFGTQKAIGLPPGLAMCSVSERAMEKAAKVSNRGCYFDFLSFSEYAQKGQTPNTPVIPLIFALNYQLDKILKEGLENRFKRHKEMADIVRAWAKEHFELFPEERYASNTVTCVKNTKSMDVAAMIDKLKLRGYQISNGYGKLKGVTFRIGHMADRKVAEVKELLKVMDEILW